MRKELNVEKKKLGRYELLEEIGQGGMATVYKGVQPSLNRIVAIKVLPKQFARDAEFRERFAREAKIVAVLQHPNIIQVIDQGTQTGLHYFVMEYIEGTSLDKLLKEKGKLSLSQALYIMGEVCKGVACAHRQGVVHRDLKPSNILIAENGKLVKISDFGIAFLATSAGKMSTLTGKSVGMGSLNYMSPEQRQDSANVDKRTDIYALGIILHEMLTGKIPLGSFSLPSHTDSRIPAQIDDIVLKCIKENREDRFSSVEDVSAALKRHEVKYFPGAGEFHHFAGTVKETFKKALSPIFWEKKSVYIILVCIFAFMLGLWALLGIRAKGRRGEIALSNKKEFIYGETLIKDKLYDKAIAEFRKFIDEHPQSELVDEAQFKIGQIEEKRSQHKEAIAEYRKVPALYPESNTAADAQFKIGIIYEECIGDEDRAVDAFKQLYETYPANPLAAKALYEAGTIQKDRPGMITPRVQKKAFYLKAIQFFELLMNKYPKSDFTEDAFYQTAELYRSKELAEYDKALERYNKFLEKYPSGKRPARYAIAQIYDLALKNRDKAIEAYNEVIAKRPGTKEAAKAKARIKSLQAQAAKEK